MKLKLFMIPVFTSFILSACSSDSTPNPKSSTPTGTSSCGDSILLTWTPPTARTDNTPLLNLYGYEIHWGRVSRFQGTPYSNSLVVINNQITSYVVGNLQNNETLYFAMKAIDSDGLISPISPQEVTKVVPSACQSGQKPIDYSKPKDGYQKPSWCNDKVEINYFWDPIPFVTEYRAKVGYRRTVPSKEYSFQKNVHSFTEEVQRGKIIYTSLNAYRFSTHKKLVPESMYHVLTCKQLEEKLAQDPDFKENLDLKLKWRE